MKKRKVLVITALFAAITIIKVVSPELSSDICEVLAVNLPQTESIAAIGYALSSGDIYEAIARFSEAIIFR